MLQRGMTCLKISQIMSGNGIPSNMTCRSNLYAHLQWAKNAAARLSEATRPQPRIRPCSRSSHISSLNQRSSKCSFRPKKEHLIIDECLVECTRSHVALTFFFLRVRISKFEGKYHQCKDCFEERWRRAFVRVFDDR